MPLASAKPPLTDTLEGTASKNIDKLGKEDILSQQKAGKRKPNGTLYGLGNVGLLGQASDSKNAEEKGGAVIDLKNRPTSSGVHLSQNSVQQS